MSDLEQHQLSCLIDENIEEVTQSLLLLEDKIMELLLILV